MRITVVGAGFVGVTTSVALAEHGHDVRLVETDPARARALRRGRVPFYEPGVQEAFEGLQGGARVRVHDSLGTVPGASVVLLCVGTPPAPDGSADLSQVRHAAHAVAHAAARWREPVTVAVKSTVPPGTTREVVGPALAERLDRFGLAMNPEFLREGTALADARAPDRIVIGGRDADSTAACARCTTAPGAPRS